MDEKRKNILDISKKMFTEYGIRSVSMDDICKQLNISKKTLYQCFDNKASLLEALIDFEMEQTMDEAKKIKSQSRNAIHALLLVSKTMSQVSTNSSPAVAYDLKKYYPELYKKLIQKKREMAYKGISMNMERGIKEGLYRDDLNIELTTQLYIKKVEQMHDKDFMEDIKFSPESIFKVMFETHIRGIANSKGIETFKKEKENLNFNINDTTV